MKRIFLVLLFCIISVWSFPESLDLTLDRAIELAMENNLPLLQDAIEVKTLKRNARNAFSALLPSINGSAALVRPNYAFNSQTMEEIDPSWTLSLELSAQLVINPALLMSIKNTRLDYARGLISYEAAKKSLVRDVKKNYFSLLLLQENIRLAESNLATAKQRFERAQNSFANGTASELSLLKTQSAYENLKPVLSGLRLNYEKALNLFKAGIGLDDISGVNLTTAIPDIHTLFPDELFSSFSGSENPAIREISAVLAHLRHSGKTAAAGLGPSLIIGFSYTPAIAAVNEDTIWSGAGNDWLDAGALTIAVQLPVGSWLPFSGKNTEIQELNDSIESLELQLKQTEQMVFLEIRSLVMDIENSRTSIATLEFNAGLAGKVLRLAESSYEAGVVDFLEVEDATDRYNEAVLELLSGKLDYLTAILDLEYTANTVLLETAEKK
ncbi:MAG: TolC family protein [Spirochaetales bacterium]|nr:TolC family protein [Spirochaetales bacterium]